MVSDVVSEAGDGKERDENLLVILGVNPNKCVSARRVGANPVPVRDEEFSTVAQVNFKRLVRVDVGPNLFDGGHLWLAM